MTNGASRQSPICLDGPLARRHRASLIGTGDKLVVFSHGLGTDQSVWNGVLSHLADDYRALVFDLPGAGPLLPADFDPDDYHALTVFADDVLALLDEVGVTQCQFVGHSVSGMIAALAAVEAPDLFAQLILLNASPRYLNAPGYVGGFDAADIDGLLRAMATNYQAWVAGFAPAALDEDVGPEVEHFSACLMAMRPDITVRVARTIFNSDYRGLLPALSTPTALIHSRNDIAVPPQVADFMHSHIQRSTLTWIDASGHLPHMTAPAHVAKALRASLAH